MKVGPNLALEVLGPIIKLSFDILAGSVADCGHRRIYFK